MAETIVTALASDIYEKAIHEPVEIAVPDSATTVRASVPRCTTDDPLTWPEKDTTIAVHLDQDVDGKWRHLVSFTAHGGVAYTLKDKNEPTPISGVQIALRPGKSRRVLVTLEVLSGVFNSEVSVTFDAADGVLKNIAMQRVSVDP